MGDACATHALTVDIEDWAALMCMYSGHTIPASPLFSTSAGRLIDLLEQHDVQGTFFIVGRHAAEQPQVVRWALDHGHEVGSHTWTHRPVGSYTPREFREDLRRSLGTLEDAGGETTRGCRCPFFSLLPDHIWALEAMAEAGFEYDSSLFVPAWHRAGVMIPEQPFVFRLPSGREIVESPIPGTKWGPMTLRFIGGRGTRLAPTNLSVRHLEERERAGLPGLLYFHTYEVTSENLGNYVPSSVGWRARFSIAAAALGFQVGRGRLQRLVQFLLERFTWAPMREVITGLRRTAPLPLFDFSSPRDRELAPTPAVVPPPVVTRDRELAPPVHAALDC